MKTYIYTWLFIAFATPVCAATYNFHYTYDGANAVWDAASDDPLNQVLEVGDSYVLTINAQANKAWNVLSSYQSGLDNAFWVGNSGVRHADVTATQALDGNVVNSEQVTDLLQLYVHAGGQQLSYTAGSVFDQFTLRYTLLAGSDVTTILNRNPGFHGTFLNSPYVDYIDAPDIAAVPLPASLPLLFASFAGLAAYSRRRRA